MASQRQRARSSGPTPGSRRSQLRRAERSRAGRPASPWLTDWLTDGQEIPSPPGSFRTGASPPAGRRTNSSPVYFANSASSQPRAAPAADQLARSNRYPASEEHTIRGRREPSAGHSATRHTVASSDAADGLMTSPQPAHVTMHVKDMSTCVSHRQSTCITHACQQGVSIEASKSVAFNLRSIQNRSIQRS